MDKSILFEMLFLNKHLWLNLKIENRNILINTCTCKELFLYQISRSVDHCLMYNVKLNDTTLVRQTFPLFNIRKTLFG